MEQKRNILAYLGFQVVLDNKAITVFFSNLIIGIESFYFK